MNSNIFAFSLLRYFVLNFVDYDLSKVIKRGRHFSEDHIKLLIYSLLRGLKFIHSAGVIHRVRTKLDQVIISMSFSLGFKTNEHRD